MWGVYKEDACGRWGGTWEKLGELSDGDVALASDEGGGGCLETSWFFNDVQRKA